MMTVSRTHQYPAPLTSTGALPSARMSSLGGATVRRSAYPLDPLPSPPPNRIGTTDLPGGFERSNVLSGQAAPLGDLSRGLVRIDGVAVLFDVSA